MSKRIEMLKKLGLADQAKTGAISAVSRIRNKLVHNVHETDFTFDGFFTEVKERQWFSNYFQMDWENSGPTIGLHAKLAVFSVVFEIAKVALNEQSRYEKLHGGGDGLSEATGSSSKPEGV